MLHLLQQKKEKLTTRMKELWAVKDVEKKDWTREESDEYAQLEADADQVEKELKQRIEYQRFLSETKPVAEKKFDKETKSLGLHSICRALLFKKTNDSTYSEDLGKVQEFTREGEIQQDAKPAVDGFSLVPSAFKNTMREYQRALDTTTASGGDAIEDFVETPTLDVLYARTVLSRAGAKVKELPQGTGAYKVVKLVDASTAKSTTKAEGTDLDVEVMTIDDVFELKPKKLGRVIEVSNLWLRQAKDPGVVERALLKEWGSTFDSLALDGDGSGANPSGILRTSGLLEVAGTATNGDALSWTKLITAIETIEKANGDSMSLSWLINPQVKRKASDTLIKSASGSELLFNPRTQMLAGLKTIVSTLLPSNKTKGSSSATSWLFLTDPEMVCLPFWGLPTLALNDKAKDWYLADETGFRVQGYANVGLERPETSHCVVKDILTT